MRSPAEHLPEDAELYDLEGGFGTLESSTSTVYPGKRHTCHLATC